MRRNGIRIGRGRCCAAGVLGLMLVLLAGCAPERLVEQGGAQVFYGSSTRIRGFDPVHAGDVSTGLAVGRVYEGLYQYDYKTRPYRVHPLLAEGMPEVSEDGLVYTIRLRPGILFQDDACFPEGRGREVCAADVVYSIKRIADVQNGSGGYWAFRGRIEGLDAFRAASSDGPVDYAQEVEGLRALDEYTLQLRLTEPYPQLLWVLAMMYASVVPMEAVEHYGEELKRHPVGTGPYQLKEWRRNYRLEYVLNPNWRPRDPAAWKAGGGQGMSPAYQRLVYLVMDDASTRWLAFLNGQLALYSDIAQDNWDVIFSADGTLSDTLTEQGLRLHTISGLNVYYIGFNMDDPVVGTNKKLRQALTCAFNSQEWVNYYNGRIVRASGPIPSGVAGHVDAPSPYPFNLEKSQRLLAEAGYPEGVDPATGRRLVLALELGKTDADMRESTELFCSFMRKIGVVIEPSYNNKPAFFEKIAKRQAQMFRLSWFADYPDGQNFLQLFYSRNASPGPNRVNYSNPAFDALYERAVTLPDTPERTELYRQLAAMVIEDCPWIFTHYPMDYSLSQQGLENYVPHDFPYGMEKYYQHISEGSEEMTTERNPYYKDPE